MALSQGERSLHIVQVGAETVHGTPVAATQRLAGFSTGIANLDRSPSKVSEDFGDLTQNEPGRGYYGVRLAKMPYRSDLKYEECIRLFAAGIEGGVTPSTVASGVYSWAFLGDLNADSLTSLTIEEGDNIQAYQMAYGLVESYRLSYNALAAPGNSPWQIEANFIGQDMVPISFTGSVSVVANAETPMGHLTRAYIGTTSTVWGSLSEQIGLLAFDITLPTGVVPRVYGAATDTFLTHGRAKRDPTGTMTFYQTSSTKSALFDPFRTFTGGSPVMVEFRLRIQAIGGIIATTYHKQFTLDTRFRFAEVPHQEDANGATVYAGRIELVNDATLGSDHLITVQNGIAS